MGKRAEPTPPAGPLAGVALAWQQAAVTMDVLAAAGDTPQRLAGRQARRLAALVAHAVSHSRFHRERLAGLPPGDVPLAQLPVLRRSEMMAAFDELVTDPAVTLAGARAFVADPARIGDDWLGHLQVWHSSGSTGTPGVYLHDAAAMAVYDALEALRRSDPQPWRRWLDPVGSSERLAFVGAIDGHFASIAGMRRLARRNPWLGAGQGLGCFSILQPTAALVAALNDHAPTLLATYPTAAGLLADEARAGRLRARPREVWTGGEALSPALRRHIEQHLGATLRHSYGASEFLPIAWECRHGALHVNADWVILEPVDEAMQPVPPGTLSATTLLTNLANRVQPLIRYDLGDRTRWLPGRCACGSPLPVIEVEGRCDERLLMDSDLDEPVSLLPMALTTLLEDEAGLYDFELVQVDRKTLLLRVARSVDLATDALARAQTVLEHFARRQGAAHARVLVESAASLPRPASGKARRVAAMPGRDEPVRDDRLEGPRPPG